MKWQQKLSQILFSDFKRITALGVSNPSDGGTHHR